jgi:hypothetical protein
MFPDRDLAANIAVELADQRKFCDSKVDEKPPRVRRHRSVVRSYYISQ